MQTTDAPRQHTDDVPNHLELLHRAPDLRLRDLVRLYQGFAERTTDRVRRLEVPITDVVVIINFGQAYLLSNPTHPLLSEARHSFVAGLHDTYTLAESPKEASGMEVHFTPIGAHIFFGVPMHELTNRVVDLDDILDPALRSLVDQLGNLPTWEQRFRLLDQRIAARFAQVCTPSSGVLWAWQRLNQTGGQVDIRGLAHDLGYSQKHLIDQFHTHLGLTPKKLARVLRFNRAIRLLDQPEELNWAAIASDCGYYDQSHLIKDFQQFTGGTPGEFLRHRELNNGGVVSP